MAQGEFRIRTMSGADLDRAIEWAAAEGWNPGLADRECFHAADPDGFLVGELDGVPIASISVLRYDAGYGFLGFYIVVPERRGKGYGLELWNAGMDYLGARVVGLDGVPDQQANYAKSGFVLAHRNVRYGGRTDVAAPDDPDLVPLDRLAFGDLVAYDRAFVPAPRERFLRCWMRPEQRTGIACVRDGEIRGYGVIRACRDGHKIGPLFADDRATAERLFRALAAARGGEGPVFLDPPEPNGEAVALAESHGLAPVFETARMYKGPAPELPIARTFGITTFEVG